MTPQDVLDAVTPVADWPGAVRVWTTDTHDVEVVPMMFNDRIVLRPHAFRETYDAYWCYDKGGPALVAAAAWVAGGCVGEPAGWKKAHGERYPNGRTNHP